MAEGTPWRSSQEVLHRAFDAGSEGLGLAPYRGVPVSQAVTVGTSAVQLPGSPLVGRKVLMIRPPVDLYIGGAGVTTASGFPVAANTTITLEVGESVTIYGVCGSAGNSVRVMEIS